MVSVIEALEIVLKSTGRLPAEMVSIEDGYGAILAKTVTSPSDFPRTTQSAMDGYAVRAGDLSKASGRRPLTLKIRETIPAGKVPRLSVHQGECSAIMTGAIVPKGADAVIRVEDTHTSNGRVFFLKPARRGENIRYQGEVIRKGAPLLPAGRKLSAEDLGVLASVGVRKIPVFRRPRVAIFSTGSEVAPYQQSLRPGQIPDSNRLVLKQLLKNAGAVPVDFGIVRDDRRAIEKALKKAARSADAVITIGGVSMGKFDYVRTSIEKLGALKFWKVRMKPGGPFTFGLISGTPVFGLPGNPVSSVLCFRLFALPGLLKMRGEINVRPLWRPARLSKSVRPHPEKVFFLPVHLRIRHGKTEALPHFSKGSHDLGSFSNLPIAWIPPGNSLLMKKSPVRILKP